MKSLLYFVLWLCFTIDSMVLAIYSTKDSEGYPLGFWSNCSGSNKKAIIKKESLKYLSFTVVGPGPVLEARRKRYTYHQMNRLAKDPDIDFSKKTLLFVSGYLDSASFPLSWTICKPYKDLGYNAIILDTNKFTTFAYPVASRFMRPVGVHTAEMLANLTRLGLDPKKLEILGLSLGGQTISYIAKNYKLQTGITIGRLTGLDPAGPCFRNLGPEDRLDMTDADFVDVIHTNIDGFGTATPIGHVNFYVNGGEFQPALDILMPCDIMCSHIRVIPLWLASIYHPHSFIGLKCDSVQQARDRQCYDRTPRITNVMGLSVDKTKPGIFYLATLNTYPYFLGKKGLDASNEPYASFMGKLNAADVLTMR